MVTVTRCNVGIKGNLVSTAQDNERLVRAFCASWESKEVNEIMAYFAPDAIYHNIPMAPLRGHEEIEGFLSFLGMVKAISFEILVLLADDHRVFTERVDHFEMPDGKTIDLPVCGILEIEGGKITAWRDYFDAAPFADMFS